tara:strand:- start:144 stop:2102 length:1959 start_codon:yes stop_codon:yes gene_type:complete
MGAIVEVKYFNSFWAKQVQGNGSYNDPKWPGVDSNPYGYPVFPVNAQIDIDNWYIEEARIKGGFNNKMVSQGVRAYLNEKNPIQDIRESSLIYSGVYNSRTAFNETNVFSIGKTITSNLDPSNGSIQKLFAEDTNLVIFQENKVSKSLINKNTIYSGTQGAAETPDVLVIGQNVPYSGRFGIGKNPESFAQYGFRKYFADPIRGSILRLSRDGLTEISNYGMKDYFRDNLSALDSNYKTENVPWTIAVNPPRSIKDGEEVLAAGLDLTNYTFLNPGTTANIQVTSNNAGINAEVVVSTDSQLVVQIDTTSIGGSGYRVGDIITVPGDGVNFNGSISLTLTSAELNTSTGPQNPFYVQDVSSCDVFLGSAVLNLNSSNVAVDTGAIITNTSIVTGSNPVLIAVTTNNTIDPEDSGFFSYEYKSKIVGGWDNYNRYYTVSLQSKPAFVSNSSDFTTLSFDDGINGWVSRYSYKPGFIGSLKGSYLSTYENSLYQHYESNVNNNNFLNYYGVRYACGVNFFINSNPSIKKNFQTINYEGDNGWEVSSFSSDSTKYNNSGQGFVDSGSSIKSFNEGLYVDPNSGYPQRAGFDRKENLYVAEIQNQSNVGFQEVLPGSSLTGIKGYLININLNVDSSTNLGGPKEIWSVGTTFKQSS